LEDLSPAPEKPLETKEDPSLSKTPETAWSPAVLPTPPVAADLEAGSYGGNFGFAPSFGPAALRDEEPSVEESANEEPIATEAPMPMDLEDLYASTGFGAPAEDAKDEPGFGETLANTNSGMSGFNPAGFGAFLQNPAPSSDVEKRGSGPASPWSAPGSPSFESPEPPAVLSPILDEAAPAVAGFASPSPWGPPISLVPEESVIDAPPTRITEETPLSDWASAFENPPKTEDSFSAPKDTTPEILSPSPAPPAFAGFAGFGGFDAAFGGSSQETEKTDPSAVSGDAPSGFFFNNAPTSTMLFGRSEAGEASFAVPGHCFSTGSSSEPEPKTFEALFPSASEEGARPSIFEASEPEPGGPEAPLFEAGEGEPRFPSIKQGPSLFGDSPFVSFQDEPAPATSQEPAQGQGSAFSDVNAAPVPPSVAPEILPAPSPAGAAIPSAPAIPTLPLGPKPKPKVRKGFLVLMVIIVGFASGAALASFVLPVDEYVQTARAYMEKKFNPAGITPQTLPDPIPTGSDAPAATPAP